MVYFCCFAKGLDFGDFLRKKSFITLTTAHFSQAKLNVMLRIRTQGCRRQRMEGADESTEQWRPNRKNGLIHLKKLLKSFISSSTS